MGIRRMGGYRSLGRAHWRNRKMGVVGAGPDSWDKGRLAGLGCWVGTWRLGGTGGPGRDVAAGEG